MWKKYFILILLAASILPSISHAWYSTNWTYAKNITFNGTQVNEDNLTSFPVLISITDSNLSTFAQADGDDILFTNSTDSKLDHEIEFYNSTNGNLIAWVRIPTLRNVTANTTIRMYYNNSAASNQQNKTGVWASDYVDVFHMNMNTTSGAFNNDSTGKMGSFMRNTENTDTVLGQIGNAVIFNNDSVGERIEKNNTLTFFNGQVTATFSAWANPRALNALAMITGKYTGGGVGWGIETAYAGEGGTDDLLPFVGGNDYGYSTANVQAVGRWSYYVMVFNGSGATDADKLKLYVNGTQVTLTYVGFPLLTSLSSLSANMTIGTYSNGLNPFNGTIDEVKTSDTIKTAGWIQTEYNNQFSPLTFYKINGEETSPVTASSNILNVSRTCSVFLSNSTNGGTSAWSSPSNANTSDNLRTGTGTGIGVQYTEWLQTYNCSFSLNSNATVLGISVLVEKNGDPLGRSFDNGTRLTKNFAIAGDRRSNTTVWNDADTNEFYGNSTDLWGTTWTFSDINNAGFGAVFAGNSTLAALFDVDYMNITVFYNETASADSCTPTANQDWNINAADNCYINGKDYTVKYMYITGTGSFSVRNSNITATGCSIRPSIGNSILYVLYALSFIPNSC